MRAFQHILFSTFLILISFSVYADPPAFKKGQIAVYAEPGELPSYSVIKYLPNAGISVLQVAAGKEMAEIAKLRAKGRRAELNFIMTHFYQPDDEHASLQWHFDKVQAPAAWDTSKGNASVIVAVLDTGLATMGSVDGIGCVVPGYDIVNDDSDPIDGEGHGTHVSGTIAQTTDNGVGTAGLAHLSCVMPVKVLNDNGSGTSADIADGIFYAVNNNASVINMSLGFNARGGVTNNSLLDPALDYAYANDVTVVCAAGNDGHRKNVSYPAIYLTTIAVGATDYRNRIPRYSNRGTGLDLVAPGGDNSRDDNGDGFADGVLQETFSSTGWSYWFYQGTSMATPHVAAAAALLIANGTAIAPDDIRSALTDTALDIGDAGFDSSSAHGLLQVADALSWVPIVVPTPTPTPIPTPEPSPTPPPGGGCTDNDNDGYCVEEGDCNDNSAKIHPGANDTRGKPGRDGIDTDCNGIIDG